MVSIENRSTFPGFSFNERQLADISAVILHDFFEAESDFSLSFVNPDEIRSLNSQYREHDEVTDVLAFPSGGEIDPETAAEYIGDILICTERAFEQASASKHPAENEIALLLIHGLLHLIGYDHQNAEEKTTMWAVQSDYLQKFNIVLGREPGEEFENEA